MSTLLDLLEALAKNGHAAELPELERFLRLEVQQLIDALSAKPQELAQTQDRSQKCQTAFAPVEAEILEERDGVHQGSVREPCKRGRKDKPCLRLRLS